MKHSAKSIRPFIGAENFEESSTFYKEAIFYSPERIVTELKRSGYKNFVFYQTLFQGLSDIKELELPKPGFGEGSFVVIRSEKK